MSSGQKYSFNVALSEMIQQKTADINALAGRLLPAHVVAVSGQLVTVHFDILPEPGVVYPDVTIPIATFEYLRWPVQVGDKGVTLCADVSLALQTGQGINLPSRAAPPSLTALYFLPLASTQFSEVDPNKITLYGPDGAVLRTQDNNSKITVNKQRIDMKTVKAIELDAEEITLNAKVIYLNGEVKQEPSKIPGSTKATLIGPVKVENEVSAADFSTPKVKSVNDHEHDVKNVQSGGSTITTEKPKG